MSRLSELIKKLCPDGVEYRKLDELGKFYGGITGKSKDDFKDGNAVFITYKNVYANPALDITPEDRVKISESEKQRTLEYGDIIFTGSSETPDECGFSSVVTQRPTEKLYLNSFCFFFRLDDLSILEPDFAKHIFRSHDLRRQISRTASGVTRFNVSKDKMKKVKIPVPPLEVQREIVRILDSFTLLTAELTAELTARKTQYEYYRHRLIAHENEISDVLWIPLKDATNSFRGSYITKKNTIPGNIPVILGGQEPAYYINRQNHEGEIVCIARSGASAGFVSYWNEPIFVTDGFGYEAKAEITTNKYLFYVLKDMEETLNGMKRGAGVPHVSGAALGEIKIPFPPLVRQKQIVETLERFDELANSISEGLPAEIEVRQKQYEYYRDKLLTFKEKEA